MTRQKNTFNGKFIRAEYSAEGKEWLFSAVDVATALTGSKDPRRYWSDIKRRLKEDQLSAKIVQLKMMSADGKTYKTDVLNTDGVIELSRIIRSPHTKAFVEWVTRFIGAEKRFILKHKDIDVIELEIDENGLVTSIGKTLNESHLPVGTVNKNGIDAAEMKDWWKGRSIPASRDGLRDFLESLDIVFPQELLKKSFGLSLSDQYWICPRGEELRWADINFFHNEFSEDIGNLLFGKKDSKDIGAIDLTSPDNTSDGVLKKRWKIINGKRCLIKGGTLPINQEIANEVLASRICERLGIPHVNYWITELDDDRYSVCEDFITGETELVPAYRIKTMIKKENHVSDYDSYINKVEELGIPDVRKRMDMMLVLDFIIANSDRHYNNFGLVRNADTLEWISVAPVYDSGTSMWCRDYAIFNTGKEESKPFRGKHADQIELVSDLSWLNVDALDGIEKEYMEMLSGSVKDPSVFETRNKALCSALRTRIDMLKAITDRKRKKLN
jgi:hypothetical protein